MTPQEMYEAMWETKIQTHNREQQFCYAELARDIPVRYWNGHGASPEFREGILKAGTTVKAIMVSRFGDVGITEDLTKTQGYCARLQPTSENFTNCRLEP